MAICPICQSEIEITTQHYGTLFTCPKCNAVFFVDWEGHPETSSDRAINETSDEISMDIPPEELGYPEETPQEIPHAMAQPEEDSSNYDFSQPLETLSSSQQDLTEPKERDATDFSDIVEFGNADLGQAAFNYTLTISGIDSAAIRAQIEEALSDSKFNWNVIQLMAQINGGVLIIRSMNAVKASILMQRVKYLPVKVSWRQNVLSGAI